MKTFLMYLGILGMGILFLVNGSAFAETLQDAVSHMLQTNPSIKEISYKRLARDQEVIQAKSGYYPSLDLYSGYSFTERHEPTHYKVWPKRTVLGLRQNVFRFYATTFDVARQNARVESAAYELQADSEDIALQACRVYLDVLRNLELHDLATENLTNHQQIYDQMKLRSQSGVDRKADLDQVMGRLALAESNIAVTLANIVDAKTDYHRVIGRMPEDLIRPEPVDSIIPPSMEEAVEQAVRMRPRLKSAQADLEAREYQCKTAKSLRYPSLDLALDYSWENDVAEPGLVEEFRATGSVSYNIFNGFADQARVKETKYLVSEANEILRNTERETIQSIRLSWEAFDVAKERVTHLEQYVKSTGLTVEAFGKQWMIGRRTMFDVLDTQAEYINAKSDLVDALYDKMYAEYRILNGIGSLVHALDLQWPDESHVVATKVYAPVPTMPEPKTETVTPVPEREDSSSQERFYKSINPVW
ncbi:TolC family outer membrane protein [Thermodesulfobacteriota bacterium]